MKIWIWVLIVAVVLVGITFSFPGDESGSVVVKVEDDLCTFDKTEGCSLECSSDNDCIVAGNSCSCINENIDFNPTCTEFGEGGIGCKAGVVCDGGLVGIA